MPLADILTDYRATIAECQSFVSIAFQQDTAGNYVYPLNQRAFIAESAFLRIFIAWETFLQRSFISYLLGEPSIAGTVIVRYATPLNEDRAHKMLIGTQKYVDWSNPDIVKRLSLIYFDDTNPIHTTLNAIQVDLADLKTLRNAAAHVTISTATQLDALATRKTGSTSTNATVSDVLFFVDPLTTNTILTDYLNILDTAAEAIAHA